MLRLATEADTEVLIAWMRELWRTDTEPFQEHLSRRGLRALLDDAALGRVWIVTTSHPERSAASGAGYLVLTFGFSLEFGGRDAFIDEFYLEPAYRSMGIGSAVLDEVGHEAARLGVNAIHLEVADANDRAEALYRRRGFQLHSRRLMTRWLAV